jgi:hypothetical protein
LKELEEVDSHKLVILDGNTRKAGIPLNVFLLA